MYEAALYQIGPLVHQSQHCLLRLASISVSGRSLFIAPTTRAFKLKAGIEPWTFYMLNYSLGMMSAGLGPHSSERWGIREVNNSM